MGRKGGKKWNRKRKADERNTKSSKERTNVGPNGSYNIVQYSNAKFEAYYSLVGLHDTRYDDDAKQFVPCQTDEEKHAERNLFMSTLTSILPASFRVDRSLDPTIQATVLEELQQFLILQQKLPVHLWLVLAEVAFV